MSPDQRTTDDRNIPNEWATKALAELLKAGRLGGNYPNQAVETQAPLMKMGNLARGHFDLSKVEFICPGVKPDPAHRLARGDVLFNTRNTLDLVGKVAIWRDELSLAYYNSNLMRLEFEPAHVSSNDYANYALNTAETIARLRALATGTTSVAAIYTRDLLKLSLPVPPASEQQAIAAALGDVDALLGALDRLIAKKRDLKQAAMQQLLTGRTRLAGFSAAWESTTLGAIGRWFSGGTPAKSNEDFWRGDIPWVSPKDMKAVRIHDAIDHVGASAVGNGTRLLPKGAILVVVRGMILAHSAPVARTERVVAFNQDIKGLVANSDVDSNFVLWWLVAHESLLLSTTNEATHGTKRIPTDELFKLPLRLPSLPEQGAIAGTISDMDAELAALEQRRDKTRLLKQGMMQELLTGRIRLV